MAPVTAHVITTLRLALATRLPPYGLELAHLLIIIRSLVRPRCQAPEPSLFQRRQAMRFEVSEGDATSHPAPRKVHRRTQSGHRAWSAPSGCRRPRGPE